MLKIIAEIGGNHLGSLDRALKLVYEAAHSGATHVKFQCFTPEQMVGDPEYVLDDGPWKGKKLIDLYRKTHTPRSWFPKLFEYARNSGIAPFASVFHENDVDFLETLNCAMYKISSFEAVDLDLIEYAAGTGKRIILSTGMLTQDEISDICDEVIIGGEDMIFLKCTSAYPAGPQDANLMTMVEMKWDGLNVGISDHTPGCGVAVAAVALGATVVEKHLKVALEGPDAKFSMWPEEFAQMAEACQQAYAALGKVHYGPTESEKPSLKLRRSLWWDRDLKPGDVVTREDIKCCRPADGLSPSKIDNVIGREVRKRIQKNTPIGNREIRL